MSGDDVTEKVEVTFKDAARHQHETLRAILERNAGVLGFIYASNATQTRGGSMAMAATAFPLYSNNPNLSRFLSLFISPKEVIIGGDVNKQTYCHLFAVLDSLM
ncbi:hypothetical protein C2S51_024863 [Perilla frutescens var. frutescens]|nr:hypothetical protein C2S51_024863 [Perilla frutescens var. frutescens]